MRRSDRLAFLIIENPDHPAADERRVVTDWMPLSDATRLRELLIRRAAHRGTQCFVHIQQQVLIKDGLT